MSGIHLTVPVLNAHGVGILAVYPSVTASRTVTTKSYAEAIVNGVAGLTAPHALRRVVGTLFCDTIADGSADLLDLRSGKRRGNVERRVNMTLEASNGVGTGETARTAVEGLSFDL